MPTPNDIPFVWNDTLFNEWAKYFCNTQGGWDELLEKFKKSTNVNEQSNKQETKEVLFTTEDMRKCFEDAKQLFSPNSVSFKYSSFDDYLRVIKIEAFIKNKND